MTPLATHLLAHVVRRGHGQDYSYSYNCYVSHSGSYEREDREMRDDRGQREDRDNDNGYHDRAHQACL